MNPSPLERLHNQFAAAHSSHTYMNSSAADPAKLEACNEKIIRLQQVYKLAKQEIENALNNMPQELPDIRHQIDQLDHLENDGELYFRRYEKETNTWTRWILKGLAHYTPEHIKSWFFIPKCFSNDMEKAEADTKQEYENYKTFLRLRNRQLVALKANKEQAQGAPLPRQPLLVDSLKLPQNGIKQGDPLDLVFVEIPKEGKAGGEKAKANEDDQLLQDNLAIARQLSLEEQQKNNPQPGIPQGLHPGNLFLNGFDARNRNKPPVKKPQGPPVKQSPVPPNLEEEPILDVDVDDVGLPYIPKDRTPQFVFQADPKIQTPAPTAEDIAKQQEKKLASLANHLSYPIQCLDQFNERPLSLSKFKEMLSQIDATIQILKSLPEEQQKSVIEKSKLKEATFKALSDEETHQKFLLAMEAKDDQTLIVIFKSQEWCDAFEKALAQKGFIQFGLQKVAGMQVLKLTDEQNAKVQERAFANYQGSLRLSITDTQSLGEIEELIHYIQDKKIKPCALEIHFKVGQTLTPALVKHLLTLSGHISEITLTDLQKINFKETVVAPEEELQFVKALKTINCPQLTNWTWSDNSKQDWTAEDFSTLLHAFPDFALFRNASMLALLPLKLTFPPL